MKNLNKWLVKTTAALAMLFTTTFTANAALISQNLFLDDVLVGSITVDTAAGEMDSGFYVISDFVTLEVFDPFFSTILDISVFGDPITGLFTAEVDASNIFAGIEFLEFDVISLNAYAYNAYFDAADDPAFNEFTIFDVFGGASDIVTFGVLSLGQASVVSEPPMLAMLLVAASMLYMRRRKSA